MTIERRDRTGSDAGREFHYQDAVVAILVLEAWSEGRRLELVAEGGDDIELRMAKGRTLVSVKSRRAGRGPFRPAETRDFVRDLRSRWGASGVDLALVVERFASGQVGAEISVMVRSDPSERAMSVISNVLCCAPAAARMAFTALHVRLAGLADKNGPRPVPDRLGLTGPEVDRILRETADLIDPKALGEALSAGIVEAIDFATPQSAPAF